MRFYGYCKKQHCRWCGKAYEAQKPLDRDGFCCPAHKQAHYRAYKKYVTLQTSSSDRTRGDAVTRKKRKSKRA